MNLGPHAYQAFAFRFDEPMEELTPANLGLKWPVLALSTTLGVINPENAKAFSKGANGLTNNRLSYPHYPFEFLARPVALEFFVVLRGCTARRVPHASSPSA